ncbi:hypothetical protein ACIA5H_22305 [Nocardia sp. NPDC051900]|uniref:hypothetical protein n=1 Tax=Nocardia sp. NPDC051900 TaxID=3364326 RepID=UPI0037A4BD53
MLGGSAGYSLPLRLGHSEGEGSFAPFTCRGDEPVGLGGLVQQYAAALRVIGDAGERFVLQLLHTPADLVDDRHRRRAIEPVQYSEDTGDSFFQTEHPLPPGSR